MIMNNGNIRLKAGVFKNKDLEVFLETANHIRENDKFNDMFVEYLYDNHKKELIEAVIECPKCGGQVNYVNGITFCPECTRKNISRGSLKNSLARIKATRQVYKLFVIARKKPKAKYEDLQNLIPQELLKIDFNAEYIKIIDKKSQLSIAQREFVKRFLELQGIYNLALKSSEDVKQKEKNNV